MVESGNTIGENAERGSRDVSQDLSSDPRSNRRVPPVEDGERSGYFISTEEDVSGGSNITMLPALGIARRQLPGIFIPGSVDDDRRKFDRTR